MKIFIAIDVITDPDWQHQISYKWFWYLPVTTATGDQIIGQCSQVNNTFILNPKQLLQKFF
ncbi:hypothetical protein DPMN_021035 [Dreissena polymorpha]|uniref:Uncharacterized protein n=1 Tax=Dreissena polymorpha TaxID=45954 RepID=A0A9D4NHW1_DREPO|nr:hypothetical protein DPMN_021035 [Dreissena polymorpha]